MAPGPIETFGHFVERLSAAFAGGEEQVRFGRHHFAHAVCMEDGGYRVRRLEHTREEAEAFMAEHGMFMPENAEAISTPRTLVLEAESLDALIETLRGLPWPFVEPVR